MSLLGLSAYVSSSSEEDDSSDEEEASKKVSSSKKISLVNPFNEGKEAKVLPRPSFMVEQQDLLKDKSKTHENSVFNNPFRAKEDAKTAILERHVSMTVKQETLRTIEGKKVCFNFRKGRCRFGSKVILISTMYVNHICLLTRYSYILHFDFFFMTKCTYAHDSDVKQKPTTNEEPLSKKEAFLNTAPSTEEHEDNPDAVIENNKKPKKRPGLSQGLTPSKKAMKFHEKVYNNS